MLPENKKVNRDATSNLKVWVYGQPNIGKTTFASQFPDVLMLNTDGNYKGVDSPVVPITDWEQFVKVVEEILEGKHEFKSIVIDLVEDVYVYCKNYYCTKLKIDHEADLGYGKGWTKFKDEFNEIFRGLTQLGYAVFFIGHDKETLTQLSDGTPISLIRPALTKSVKEVITGMADIYGYAHQPGGDVDKMSILTLRDPSGLIDCGCRIKYIKPEFELSYSNLVSEMAKAIEREAKEHDGQYITTERNELPVAKEYNLPELLNEFNEIIAKIPGYDDVDGSTEEGKKFAEFWFPSIQRIVESNLGKGKKISQATADQVEMVAEIVEELTDLIAKNN